MHGELTPVLPHDPAREAEPYTGALLFRTEERNEYLLQGIAYDAGAGAPALVLALALVTAGAYTCRACRINPAEVLRQE